MASLQSDVTATFDVISTIRGPSLNLSSQSSAAERSPHSLPIGPQPTAAACTQPRPPPSCCKEGWAEGICTVLLYSRYCCSCHVACRTCEMLSRPRRPCPMADVDESLTAVRTAVDTPSHRDQNARALLSTRAAAASAAAAAAATALRRPCSAHRMTTKQRPLCTVRPATYP